MADDIRQNWSTPDTFAFTGLDSLANDGNVTSSAEDLGAQSPFAITLEVKLTGNSATNTDLVEIFAVWSNDNTDFADDGNDQLVATVQMDGVNAVVKPVSIDVKGRYVKTRVHNDSGDALASSGNSVAYVPATVDQA